ncbi:hypothetical protein Tco_0344612 [Tanacetum coccineum]
MQQAELAALRETDHRRQAQMVETLRVIRDIRREMSDMQAELLALREQQRILLSLVCTGSTIMVTTGNVIVTTGSIVITTGSILVTPGRIILSLVLETDITQKDEKRSQNDKTEHGMEKTVKDKAKSKPKSQLVKVKVNTDMPEYQTYSCESCGNDAHYGYPCPSFVPDSCYKTPPVMEEEQTQPEYLQELLQSLLKDLQILNEINLKHELLQSEDQGRERNVNPRFGDSEAAVLERDDEYG